LRTIDAGIKGGLMKAMKAVILAGGEGKRLWPITTSYPKSYVKVLGKPLIEWTISFLRNAGVDDIIVITNPNHKINQGYFDYSVKEKNDVVSSTEYLKKMGVRPVVQDEPKGTAHALWCAREYIDEDFILMNSDDVIPPDTVKKVVANEGFYAAQVGDREDFGAVITKENKLNDIKEKEVSGPGLVNLNLAHLPREFIDYTNTEKMSLSKRREYELTDSFKSFAKDYELEVKTIESWHTITYFWDLIDVNLFFLNQFLSNIFPLDWLGRGYSIINGSIVHDSANIHDQNEILNSFIGPKVIIEKFAKVYDSVLEAYNRVGTSEVKKSIMMKRANAPHFNHVGDAVLCENVNLGAGTQLANLRFDNKNITVQTKKGVVDSKKRKLGQCIGANTKIGINVSVNCGVLITPGVHILPETFVKDNIENVGD